MKKLVKNLKKFDEINQIELPKWTRGLLYNFLIDIIKKIRDKNEIK